MYEWEVVYGRNETQVDVKWIQGLSGFSPGTSLNAFGIGSTRYFHTVTTFAHRDENDSRISSSIVGVDCGRIRMALLLHFQLILVYVKEVFWAI